MKKSLLFILILSTVFSSAYSQWKATKGPYGGDIQCFHEYNNALYAGTTAGLFSSVDNGETWNFVNIGFPASITALADMGGRLFAGTGGKGVICSSDNGITWQPLNDGLSTYYRFCGDCITGFSVSGNTIYAATGDGLVKLENNQNSWTSVAGGQYQVFSGTGQQMIYSQRTPYGPGASCKITSDGGQSFRNINFPGPANYDRDLASALELSNTGIFAITNNKVLYSSDDGFTWTSVYQDSADNTPINIKVIGNEVYLATAGNGVWVSLLNSISWRNTGLPNYIVKTIFKSNNNLFAGMMHSRGIFRCVSGNTAWSEKNEGLSGMHVGSIQTFKNTVVAGCEGGILISKDTGYTWRRIDLRLPGKILDMDNDFRIEELTTNGKIILAGSSRNDIVFISVDSGQTWKYKDHLQDNVISGLAIVGDRLIIACWFNLYYSDDQGITWNTGQLPPGNNLFDDLTYNETGLYLSSFYHLFYSSDGATTWNSLSDPGTPIYMNLCVNDTTLFLTCSDGLFSGPLNGSNWTHSTINNNTSPAYFKLAISNKDIFIGDHLSSAVSHSYDYGHSWVAEEVIHNHSLQQLGGSDQYAYASTPGFGIWRYKTNLVQGVEDVESFTSAIFPNPSTGSFTIRLNRPAKASICVYDVLGNCIMERVQMNGRDHLVDLSDKSKGIYFVEVLVNDQKVVRKVTLN